jgi:hypothetical protein
LSRRVDVPVADPVPADAPGVGVAGAGEVPAIPGLVNEDAGWPVGVADAVDAITTGPRCGTELHPSPPARSTAEESTRTTTARDG